MVLGLNNIMPDVIVASHYLLGVPIALCCNRRRVAYYKTKFNISHRACFYHTQRVNVFKQKSCSHNVALYVVLRSSSATVDMNML